jgi:hypothetical protein
MAFMKSKGCVLAWDDTGSYVAIPQLESISKTGEKNEFFETHTIDGVVGKTIANSGFNDRPTISAKGFYDAANTVHAALLTNMRAVSDENVRLTYTDTGPVAEIWMAMSFGFDVEIAKSDGVKFTLTCECSGNPS